MLASRLSRLEQEVDPVHDDAIQGAAGGKALAELFKALLTSIDADTNAELAAAKFNIPEGQEPTEEQLDKVEQEQMATALKPFHNPTLREATPCTT